MYPMTLSVLADALRNGDKNSRFDTLCPLREAGYAERHKSRAPVPELLSAVKPQADRDNARPIPVMPYSYYKEFEVTGRRSRYEKHLHRHYTAPLARNALLALFSAPEEQAHYLEKLSDNLWSVCELYTWCLPAHLQGHGLSAANAEPMLDEKDGFRLLPQRPDNSRSVDLIATLLAFNLSEILYLLGDKLDPIVVRRVSENIRHRVFSPFMDLNRYWYWETVKNNWPGVCAGNIGCAAIYMIRDTDLLAAVLFRVFQGISDYINSFDSEGMGTEGLSYWIFGFSSFLNFADLLYRRTDGHIDLFADRHVRAVASSYDRMLLWKNDAVSFGDCGAHAKLGLHTVRFLLQKYPGLPCPDPEAIALFGENGCHETDFSVLVRCVVWTDGEPAGQSGLPERCYVLRNHETVVSRKTVGGKRLAFAVKGGHNGISHNHNDVGAFIIDVEGAQLISDVGCGEYDREYFSESRYKNFNCGSQGHNLPIVNGGFQYDTHHSAALDFVCVSSEESDRVEMDIAAPYRQKTMTALKRSICFDKVNRHFLLEDRYRFTTPPESITERFITLGRVHIGGNGDAVITGPDQQVLRLSCSKQFELTLETVLIPRPSAARVDTDDLAEVVILNYRARPESLCPEPVFRIVFTPD